MELEILHAIQNLHNSILNQIMIFLSAISKHGEIWIAVAIFLLFQKNTRKCGISIALSLTISLLTGGIFLKNIIARVRPCYVDTSITLLITPPATYSFPSMHTFSSFAAAVTIFLFYKKTGSIAIILASVIAFSRMYLFVHYPTDILAGILLGTVTAVVTCKIVEKASFINFRDLFTKIRSDK